ncbi:MAG: hypothetical protein EA384_09330 [Spirochaetaceae bacterium]|nr:MAG: hypothetical protein EA384_09330 [Spirochaetaceae bacterium]
MKPPLVPVLTGLLLLVVVVACSNEQPTVQSNGGPRFIVPEAGEGVTLSSAVQAPIAIRERSEAQDLRVSLSSDFIVSQVINTNLDQDQMEEQIIVFKRRDDPEDRIRLLVVDFDTVRNAYLPTWEGVTRANNMRTFAIYVSDVIGDHEMEIVAVGLNNAGEQTFDLFRRTTAPFGLGLYYENVASFVSDASIEIEESDRSEAYTTMQTTGRSFPVVVYSRNRESDNPLDLLRTTYHWRSDTGRYVRTMEEEIAGASLEEAQLAALYDGATSDFEAYLAGPWYRSVADESPNGAGEIAYFDPNARRVILYRGESQESYAWLNSNRTIYRAGPGLWINLHSEAVDTVRKQAAVSIPAIDTISLSIEGSQSWNGSYRRLTPGLQRTMIRQRSRPARTAEVPLSGLYRNESGTEILFSGVRFTMRESGQERSGGYAVYRVKDHVLDLKFLDPNGLVAENRTYRLDFTEDVYDDRVVRTIKLTPARVRSSGVETISTRAIVLEQIEERKSDPQT